MPNLFDTVFEVANRAGMSLVGSAVVYYKRYGEDGVDGYEQIFTTAARDDDVVITTTEGTQIEGQTTYDFLTPEVGTVKRGEIIQQGDEYFAILMVVSADEHNTLVTVQPAPPHHV